MIGLKRRVKKLEKKQKSRTHKLKRLYKVGLSAKVIFSDEEASLGDQEDASKQGRKILDIDADEDITLDSTHFDTNPDMFGVHDIHGDEVCNNNNLVNVVTRGQLYLIEIKATKPKVRGVMIQDPSETTTTTTPAASKPSQDKGNEKMMCLKKPFKEEGSRFKYDQNGCSKSSSSIISEFEEEKRLARKQERSQHSLLNHGMA
ncbi:hypothetical protein Tco_0217724 [Tanacetum coccineum]